MNPVIDEASFDNIMGYIDQAKASPEAEILCRRHGRQDPRLLHPADHRPHHRSALRDDGGGDLRTGADDLRLRGRGLDEATLELCDTTSPYALTGCVFSQDRYAFIEACRTLRYAAGNFYLNDKPTGASVGLQPFGGARASGTNDKAGGPLNLLRWISPRTVKETFVPATDYRYPFLD